MTLPTKFRKASEGSIASYSFIDIASGTGFINWYIAEAYDGTIASYILTTDTPYSRNVLKSAEFNVNYDSSVFNLPQTVKGTALLSIGVYTSSTQDLIVTAQLQKWDGTTETNISSAISETYGVNTGQIVLLLELPLTQTIIKKGESLRLNIITTCDGTGNGGIGQDPQARDSGQLTAANLVTSATRIAIPFQLDL